MKYRDRLQIIADILSAAYHGAKKTHVMYQASLSFRQLSKYLTELLDAKLLTYNDGLLAITHKGMDFIDKHDEYLTLRHYLEQLLKQIVNIAHKE